MVVGRWSAFCWRADNRPFWRKTDDHDGSRGPQRLLSLTATRAARRGPGRLRLLAAVGCGAGVFSRATGRAGERLSRSANHRAGLEQQRAIPRDLGRVADRRTGGRVRRICGGFGGFGGNRDHRLRGQRVRRRLTCLLSQGSRRPTGIAAQSGFAFGNRHRFRALLWPGPAGAALQLDWFRQLSMVSGA